MVYAVFSIHVLVLIVSPAYHIPLNSLWRVARFHTSEWLSGLHPSSIITNVIQAIRVARYSPSHLSYSERHSRLSLERLFAKREPQAILLLRPWASFTTLMDTLT